MTHCSIVSCTGPVEARGWCHKHYRRWKRHGNPLATTRLPPGQYAHCSLPGCSEKYECSGYCNRHYKRWVASGEPGPVEPLHAPTGSGHVGRNGYRCITVNGRRELEHRLVWERHHGPIPDGYHIHHKNGDKLDNRIDNLQLLSESAHHRLHGVQISRTSIAAGGRKSIRRMPAEAKARGGSNSKCRHVRWHVNRGVVNPDCPLCRAA